MNDRTNLELARDYLKAVASMEPFEKVSAFYAPGVIFRELPNRIFPNGRVSGLENIREAFAAGQKLLSSQQYDVQSIVQDGNEVIAELVWTGTLAIAFKDLAQGSQLTAYIAMFLTFQDGKIISQRNYDCYLPF